jgi:ribosome-associated protein
MVSCCGEQEMVRKNCFMLKITPLLSIPEDKLVYTFTRASGPGGQNVNKVASAVQLRFDVRNSPVLTEEIKTRLIKLAGKKITQDGVLVIEAKRHRAQEQNRIDAKLRLVELIQKAMIMPNKRHPTRPTVSSQARRVEVKKHKGKIKRLRQSSVE